MPISIEIKLFATLGKYALRVSSPHPLASGTTVRALVHELGIPEEKAKLIFINGIKSSLDTCLEDGDRLGIFPPVGGG